MPDLSVGRPLGEHYFADQVRLYPVRIPAQHSWRRRHERGGFPLDPIQLRTQLLRKLVGEAGADLAAEHEAVTFVIPNQQGPQSSAHTFRIGEAADHELLALHALGFHPAAVATGAIWLIAAFRHDPFESRSARLREECLALAFNVFGEANSSGLPCAHEFLEARLPLFERACL